MNYRFPPVVLASLIVLVSAACDESTRDIVAPPATGVVAELIASPTSHTFDSIGQSLQITAAAIDSAGTVIPDAALAWSSSDPSVITVNSTGRVTAKAAGSAQVVVRSGTVADTIGVTVRNPNPSPGGTATYPNRPAGTRLIGAFDGSIKEANGHAFGIQDFGSWYDHNNSSDIAVVNDPTNPTGSGRSLRFTYPTNDSKAGSTTANTFAGGPYRELYVMIRVFMEPSGWNSFGNKFFYIGAAPGSRHYRTSPVQYYTDRPSGGRLRFINQNLTSDVNNANVVVGSNNAPPSGTNSNPVQQGVWLNMEYHMVAESAPGRGDGRMRVWVNGDLIGYNNAVRWTQSNGTAVGFSGMEWYAEVNSIPVISYYRLGELYIAGIR